MTLISLYFHLSVSDHGLELAELGVGVHAVTGAFKSFLKLLPEPVIPNSLQSALHDAMGEYREVFIDSSYIHKKPNSFCAGTKIIQDRAFVHARER